MIHLREVRFDLHKQKKDLFPCNLPVFEHLSVLKFSNPVTLFVGENGSGKSTLLEALALSAGSVAIGSSDLGKDETLNQIEPLVDKTKLVWQNEFTGDFFSERKIFLGC